MRGAGHWDAPALPDRRAAGHPADPWLRRLSTAADHGRLWMAVGALLALRRRLDDGLLDVQYLRADVPLSRTRAVLGALLGLGSHVAGHAETQVRRVRVVSRSGPQAVAYDGETAEPATVFEFSKAGTLTVYCCRDR
jgi:hypothetical protein